MICQMRIPAVAIRWRARALLAELLLPAVTALAAPL